MLPFLGAAVFRRMPGLGPVSLRNMESDVAVPFGRRSTFAIAAVFLVAAGGALNVASAQGLFEVLRSIFGGVAAACRTGGAGATFGGRGRRNQRHAGGRRPSRGRSASDFATDAISRCRAALVRSLMSPAERLRRDVSGRPDEDFLRH